MAHPEQPRSQLVVALRARRRARGWSQMRLAEAAGVSRPTVARLEAGKDVSLSCLGKLATALDLRLTLMPVTD